MIYDTTFFKIAANKGSEAADIFFGNYPFFQYLRENKYNDVILMGISLLDELKKFDDTLFRKIHKGTPFYWMGIASYLLNDFQSATFYFDASVTEDLKNWENPQNKPSLLFAKLEVGEFAQAAKDLVVKTQERVEEYLNIYNDKYLVETGSKKIEIEDIREKFLRPAVSKIDHEWRTLVTTFITFFLEWDYRQKQIEIRIDRGSNELFFIHLLKGCVLFESLLKNNNLKPIPKDKDTLCPILQYLKSDLGLSHSHTLIGGELEFEDVIDEVKNISGGIPKYIEITGKLRNTLGHNLIWNKEFSSKIYKRMFSCVALSNIHTISVLYK